MVGKAAWSGTLHGRESGTTPLCQPSLPSPQRGPAVTCMVNLCKKPSQVLIYQFIMFIRLLLSSTTYLIYFRKFECDFVKQFLLEIDWNTLITVVMILSFPFSLFSNQINLDFPLYNWQNPIFIQIYNPNFYQLKFAVGYVFSNFNRSVNDSGRYSSGHPKWRLFFLPTWCIIFLSTTESNQNYLNFIFPYKIVS